MDMETPLKYVDRDVPQLPLELISKIYTYLPKDHILRVGKYVSTALRKELSSYHFASAFINNNPNLSKNVLLFDNDTVFSLLGVDYPPTSQVAYRTRVTVPSPISDLLNDDDDDDDDDEECMHEYDDDDVQLHFHGSTCGLICLTIDKKRERSGYFIWNPTIGKCCELPRFSDSNSQVFGIGHSGDGNIEIVCITGAGLVGFPIVINCLNLSNRQWETIQTDALFMGTNPSYVGVAGDVLLWEYLCENENENENAEFINGYNFHTRSIIAIQKPSLLPPTLELKRLILQKWELKRHYFVRFYVAGDCLWALGEDRYQGFNFLRRYDVGGGAIDWESALDGFEIPSGMVNAVIGSSADFTRLLFLNNEEHLLVFHTARQGVDYPITFVDSPDPNGVNLPAESVSQTAEFLNLKSIEFEQTLFFPEVPRTAVPKDPEGSTSTSSAV
ncbi:uncharacterized protein LOC141648517 [Silene latifolia]|uniref:uncharacterized protein LOC141648517 n=1 Tax=Silene latifolia TaxID=37657 RepID=UPI003D7818A7